MEGKVAVFGEADFVMPFSALGLDTFYTGPTNEDTLKTAEQIIENNYALIVVAENVAELVDEVFAATQKDATPGIVVLPFTTESRGFATEALGEVLKMATGIDILHES